MSLEGRTGELEAELGRACELGEQLRELLGRLEEMRGSLKRHAPPRVTPLDVQRQLTELAVSVSKELWTMYIALPWQHMYVRTRHDYSE